MNVRPALAGSEGAIRTQALFDAQQDAFAAHPYPAASAHRTRLRALKQHLHHDQNLLAEVFTGSPAVGRTVMRTAAASLTPATP